MITPIHFPSKEHITESLAQFPPQWRERMASTFAERAIPYEAMIMEVMLAIQELKGKEWVSDANMSLLTRSITMALMKSASPSKL
jgi:hypothetical protein